MSVTLIERLLTVEEVVDHLRISRSKLYEYVRLGELSSVKMGRRVLFEPATIQGFIERHVKRSQPAQLASQGA